MVFRVMRFSLLLVIWAILVQVGMTSVRGESISELLQSEETNKRVVVEGTAIYSRPTWGMLFLQDTDAGIFVSCEVLPSNVKLGSRVRVEGSYLGAMIDDAEVTTLGEGVLPEPINAAIPTLQERSDLRVYVETEGDVVSVVASPSSIGLTLDDGGFKTAVQVIASNEWGKLERIRAAKRVRLRGAIGIASSTDPTPTLYLESLDQIDIVEVFTPPRPRPFQLASQGDVNVGDRVSMVGQITYREKERFFMEGKRQGVLVHCDGIRILNDPVSVEVVGTIEQVSPGLEIRADDVQVSLFDLDSKPLVLTEVGRNDSYRLVEFRGGVIGIEINEDFCELTLRASDGAPVLVNLRVPSEEIESLGLQPKDQIYVTGVLSWLNSEKGQKPHILSNDIRDVYILSRAQLPLVTMAHLFIAVAVVAGGGLVVFLWTRSLRSRVDQKTKDLSEAARRLRASYDASRDALVIVDDDGTIRETNSKVEGLLGAIADESVDDFLKELASRCTDSKETLGNLKRLTTYSNDVEVVEIDLVSPHRSHFEVYTARILNSAGIGEGFRWAFHDVTERKHLEESLVQAQKMEAVGRLAGGIAHDFNNLLTGIVGNLEVAKLRRDLPLRESESNIDSAESAARRAAELIKQLLGYSRKSTLTVRAGNVNEVILELRELLRHSLDASIQFNVDVSEDAWPAMIDATHLEQVLMNLCVNARDALPEKGGAINITTKNVCRNRNEFVCITVEDNGRGIPESVKERIFEPFFTTKEQGKGTGLGLAMSFGIIQQHGGLMDCESEADKGTTFRIFLPRAADAEASSAEPEREVPVARKRGTCKGHILLADDESVVRAVGEGILRHCGYKVSSVADGLEALDFLAKTETAVDVVITDLTMPRMTGKELLIEVNKRYPGTPVIICSGYLVDLDAFSEEAGVSPGGFVAKPFQMDLFLDEVQRCLSLGKEEPALAS